MLDNWRVVGLLLANRDAGLTGPGMQHSQSYANQEERNMAMNIFGRTLRYLGIVEEEEIDEPVYEEQPVEEYVAPKRKSGGQVVSLSSAKLRLVSWSCIPNPLMRLNW